MILQLYRDGWVLAPRPLPFTAVSDRVFDGRMALRAGVYFRALLQAQDIFEKGCDQIVHMKPGKYYELLVSKRDVSTLHSRADFASLTSADFAKMLRGEQVITNWRIRFFSAHQAHEVIQSDSSCRLA